MAEGSTFLATKRYAVVTGANKGIDFELCKNLASKGIMVNNTGIFGAILDPQAFAKATQLAGYFASVLHFCSYEELRGTKIPTVLQPTEEQANQYEIATQLAEECLKTNYHGARIVDVSSILGLLKVQLIDKYINAKTKQS
ncbi:hypothetical protein CRYUN_Cryun23aG0141500 [Craigia yunnanensis]